MDSTFARHALKLPAADRLELAQLLLASLRDNIGIEEDEFSAEDWTQIHDRVERAVKGPSSGFTLEELYASLDGQLASRRDS